MDNSKIKNFIIMILLVVNAFLLVIVGADGLRGRALRAEAAAGVEDVLASRPACARRAPARAAS
jgi:hypothetical protein